MKQYSSIRRAIKRGNLILVREAGVVKLYRRSSNNKKCTIPYEGRV